MKETEIFIVGAKGQLGTALRQQYPTARHADIDELDITEHQSVSSFDWSGFKILINAAAYTNVDGAETNEGKVAAQKVNAEAVANLASVAQAHDMVLVHISTDYVFDGTQDAHTEDETFHPLSVYGKTKAAGDTEAMKVPNHYILRTSWVIGAGKNFVRTMLELGKKGINPAVVSDQIGRPTFTSELVRAIDYLLSKQCPFGTYNVSNEGNPASWADITREIFKLAGLDNTVTDISTAEYYKDKPEAAVRPLKSTLDLTKLHQTGFVSTDWHDDLAKYIKQELQT